MLEQGCALMKEAAGKKKFDLALQLGQQLAAEARRAHDAEWLKSLAGVNKRIKDQAAMFQEFQKAQETLKTSPDDAKANLAAGKYLCLIQGRVEGGPAAPGQGERRGLKRGRGRKCHAAAESRGQVSLRTPGGTWPSRGIRLSGSNSCCMPVVVRTGPRGGGGRPAEEQDREAAGRDCRDRRAERPRRHCSLRRRWRRLTRRQPGSTRAWSRYLRVPVVKTNSIGMKLVLIPRASSTWARRKRRSTS